MRLYIRVYIYIHVYSYLHCNLSLFHSLFKLSTYIYIIIIIIMSCRLNGYPPLLPIGRSSKLHPVSSQSCCMYVRAGRPAFARPYVGVHRSTSLMSSSLLLQQCPACLVRLTWIVFVMGGRWPYSWCFVGYCPQDLFNIDRNINSHTYTHFKEYIFEISTESKNIS